MQTSIYALLFVMIGGVAITIQNSFSGQIAQKTSPMGSAFIVQFSGAMVTGIILLFLRNNSLKGWQNVPWYMFVASGLGILVITSMVFAIPRIGVSGAVSGQLVAMLTCGALFDHFGLFGVARIPITPIKIIGMVVLLLGVFLVVKK